METPEESMPGNPGRWKKNRFGLLSGTILVFVGVIVCRLLGAFWFWGDVKNEGEEDPECQVA